MPAAPDITRWLIVVLLSIVLLIASISDIPDRRIPNWTILAIAILFLPWTLVGSGISILSSVEAALAAFLMSCCLYVFRIVGAGDSKLLTASALFVGSVELIHFLVLVALAGGVIAVASLAMQPARALAMVQMRGKSAGGRGVPYGVAIAIAAFCMVVRPLSWPALG